MHEAGIIKLKSNETVFIAGGAVVHGLIHAAGARNVRVLGRGILDASRFKRMEARPEMLRFERCTDVAVSGIILRDPHKWAVVPWDCERVTIEDVKLIGCWRYNSDGFDLVDCREVRVRHCFVRSFDDSIVVKSFLGRAIRDVRVADCVVWTDWGVSLGVTYETRTDRIADISFRDCDVLHNIACRGALTINPSDRAEIRDVRFEDIRVEDARSGLIELVVEKTRFGKDPQRGNIRGVRFRNVAVLGGPVPPSIIRGYDAAHTVEDVTIEGLVIHGRPIRDAKGGRVRIGPHAKDVRFAPAKARGRR
jgi:polygalacturonase